MRISEDIKIQSYGILWNKEKDLICVYNESDIKEISKLFSGIETILTKVKVIETENESLIGLKRDDKYDDLSWENIFDLSSNDLKLIVNGRMSNDSE